jgi:hypothetical protein
MPDQIDEVTHNIAPANKLGQPTTTYWAGRGVGTKHRAVVAMPPKPGTVSKPPKQPGVIIKEPKPVTPLPSGGGNTTPVGTRYGNTTPGNAPPTSAPVAEGAPAQGFADHVRLLLARGWQLILEHKGVVLVAAAVIGGVVIWKVYPHKKTRGRRR